jgi:hypothetical protein
MSLRNLALRCEYRSDETNLVEDFYIPCLRHSTEYWRAVGYFTSQGLLLAAEGLAAFLKHDGKMRLVASPWLDEADVDALLQGYAAREDVVLRAVLRQCEHAFAAGVSGLLRHRLACLAWLVAEERLEIKLAWPRQDLHVIPRTLALIQVQGDSMEPTLHAGDLALIDRGIDGVKDDGIYVVVVDGRLQVKRIQRLMDGSLLIKSDNPRYDPETISPLRVETVQIVGRVIWIGRRV